MPVNGLYPDQWHRELIADCPNLVLLDLISQFMQRTRRYELAFYRETKNVEMAIADHHRVITRARCGDLEGAIEALGANMASGIEPIIRWLETRDAIPCTKDRKEQS